MQQQLNSSLMSCLRRVSVATPLKLRFLPLVMIPMLIFRVFIWICLVVKRLIHPTVDGVMTMSRILASPNFQVENIEEFLFNSLCFGGWSVC